MKKIIIIGCPGSGKSYFSKKLRDLTGYPLYHLDNIYHNEDGTHIPREEFDNILRKIFKEKEWIIDGNYQRTIEMRLKECDTCILLDFPTEICVSGAEERVGKKRDDMAWFEDSLDPTFKQYIMDFSKTSLPYIYELIDKYKNKVNLLIFKSREETNNFLFEYKGE